jgi:dTDP-4-amino-4,6-dideoxygalactose transaminase
MSVPLLDLKAQYATIRAGTEEAIARVFETQRFIGGPEVDACESEIADYCGAPAAVGVTSGTDALLVSLMAEGIGDGDEVITSAYTFFATGGSIARMGAKPVFVDIDPVTFNIDPNLVAGAVTSRTAAIMPVHLFGQVAEMAPVMEVAAKHGLVVIEDACQAIGAEYQGRRAGAIGDYGCFSFFPSKNLGGAGDGGMVVCRDPARAKKVALLRNHGAHPKYYHATIGGNFRLDALQAAVVRIKLRHLDGWSDARRANAGRYQRLFEGAGLVENGHVRMPAVVQDRHVFNQYVVRVEGRDELMAYLRERDIGCEIYYPVPLHRQDCFAYLGYTEGSLPESERAAAETLALPVYPELSDAQAAEVVGAIAQFYGV